MENFYSALVRQTPGHQVGRQSHKHNQSVLIAPSTNFNKTLCNFCEGRDNYLPNCTRFLNLSPSLRYEEAKKLHLCLSCLRKGHGLQQCKSGNGKNCHMKHHTLLQLTPSPHAPLPSPSSGILDQSSQASTLIACSSTSSYPPPIINSTQYLDQYVLLATAVVFIKNRAGSFIPYSIYSI